MSGIVIHLPGVETFLQRFQQEIAILGTAVRNGLNELDVPTPFGSRSPSGELAVTRQAFQDAAHTYRANLPVHLANAENLHAQLVEAVERIRRTDAAASSAVASAAPDADAPIAGDGFIAGAVYGYAGDLEPPALPPQRHREAPYRTNWEAYNVPRHATILRDEGGNEEYATAMAFDRLSSDLGGYHWRMLTLRQELAQAWPPQESTAADAFQQRLAEHIGAVAHDALCSYVTATAVHEIVDSLNHARGKVNEYHQRWTEVTNDLTPEFWDHAAEEVNHQSSRQMEQTDSAIGDWRQRIILPDTAKPFEPPPPPEPPIPPPPQPDPESTSAGRGGGGPTAPGSPGPAGSPAGPDPSGSIGDYGGYPVPPVPGMNPVLGPSLAGAPQPVPVSPANPPSMLPVPPGISPYAPTGGAWVLPGPGVGAHGRLLPMPQASGPGGPGGPGGSRGSGGSAGYRWTGAGSAPGGPGGAGTLAGGGYGAMGGGAPGAGRGTDGRKWSAGAGNEKWWVRQGVSPLIDKPEHEARPEGPEGTIGRDDFGFDAWFAKTATPWEQ